MRIRSVIALMMLASLFSAHAFAAVGRTPGQFQVSPMGSAQYTIPIWSPPGPHGVQPHIALSYNSQQTNGYVGVGWAVSGLSSIYRCNQTIAQDGTAAPIALATADGYCMDGRRLRLTAGTYGTASSTYQTEIANFVTVEAYGSAGNGPAYWQATDANGWQYTYGGGGTTSNAQVLASGSTTSDSWQLNEVKDPYGNTMTITYLTSNVTGVVVPNVISWLPASAGSSSYNYTMTFNYGTSGSVHGYVGGTPFNNTNLLSSIAIAYQGTTLKTYALTYSNTTTATSRYLLTQIQECAGTGTSNCLSPTQVTWQAGAAGIGSGIAVSGTVASVVSSAYDLNGDGRNDVVMTSSSGTVLVAFGSSSGYGTPVATGLSNIGLAVGDIDGSGVAGLLANVSGTWEYYKWNGSAFEGTSTGISVATAASPVLADLDGDGRADFAYTDANGLVHVRLSTSTAGTVSFGADINSEVGTANFSILSQVGGSNRALHFWGDAQADLFGTQKICTQYKSESTLCLAYEYSYITLHFTGSTFTIAALFGTPFSSPNPAVDFADYNDDGCTDVLTATALLLSACNGSETVVVALPTGVTAVGGMDWNGDGRRDVLVTQSSGTLGVVLSTGTGLASTVINTAYATSVSYIAAPNLTGDGQDGLIASNGSSVTAYLHNGAGKPPDLATSVVDGYGLQFNPSYVALSDSSYTRGSSHVWPQQDYSGPLYVVSSYTTSDGIGGLYTENFVYSDAVINLEGRGFEGFSQIRSNDSRTGFYDYRYFSTSFPTTGMLSSDNTTQSTTSDSIQTRGYHTTTVTLASTANNERYFPYYDTITVGDYEVAGSKNGVLIRTTKTQNNSPDNYGNFASVVTTVTDNDTTAPVSPTAGATWTSTTVNTVSPDTSTGCLNLPSQTTVTNSSTAAGGTSITRTTAYTPDYTHCVESTVVTEPNSSLYKVTDVLGHDSFGNVNSHQVTGIGMPTRTTSINWGTTGQFPTQVTNALSQTTTLGFDPTTGMQTSQTDPNGIKTQWQYDGFERKTLEIRPDGTETAWSYTTCTGCDPLSQLNVTAQALSTSGKVISTRNLYYDMFDRQIDQTDTLLSGAVAYSLVRHFDTLGRVQTESFPYLANSSAPGTQTYGYDLLNRVTSITRPISATNSNPQTTYYTYAGRTSTVKDPLGNTTTKITLPTGSLARSQGTNGYYQNFTYDAFGSLLSVTDSASPANTLFTAKYGYGIRAFQTSSTDMDLGARSYTVDALGEVTAYTDAKSQTFSMQYDLLSRPSIRTDPEPSGSYVTTWNWGASAASYNIGKLQSITATSSTFSGAWSDTYTYDTVGRLSTETYSNPGDRTYEYIKTYDPTTGLLASLQYPVDMSSILTLQYAYANGILQSISSNSYGPAVTYWTANAVNPRGQVTQESYGNGVVKTLNYDAITGWLSSIQAGDGGGAGLQNNSFAYDEDGNVSQRQDNNAGLTEDFYYDAMNRLDHSTLNGTLNLQMTYDTTGMGNITARSDVASGAAWTYDPNRKHAVTQAGSASYTYAYDANGNMTSRSGYTIPWTSYNYPLSVSSSGESVSFAYDGNRQRWQEIYTGPSGTETTYHAGKLFEVAYYGGLAHYRHYVYAGNELVSVDDRTTATQPQYYVLSDHQGSIASFTGTGQSCPAGYTLSGSNCVETLSQAATASYSCPSGYTLSGTSCVDSSSTPATAHYSCPTGYSLSGTTCSETVTASATLSYSCPTGYSLSGTTCSETLSQPAVYGCGNTVSANAQGVSPDACTGGGSQHWVCPTGWTLSGTTCYETLTQAATPVYSCPTGYTLSGTTCSETLTQAATVSYSCPSGYTLSGSTCSETSSVAATVTYSCPSGYSLSGSTCSETLTATPTGTGANVFVAESFTPYGLRRSGETWSGAPSSGDESNINSVSRLGYTQQTALGISMGLTHMNGRVEDSITGRFLSPDPNIPNPGNTQDWNRYSYVGNNPLTLVDPTGFTEHDCGTNDGTCGGTGSSSNQITWNVEFDPTLNLPSDSGGSDAGMSTGSMNGGSFNSGWSCYGNCVGQYANSIQVLNSNAPETVSVANANGSNSYVLDDADANQSPSVEVDAPGYHWVSTGILDQGFNFAPFAAAATQISMGRVLGQFAAITAGGSVGAAFKGTYAGIGAIAGAIGGGKATHGNPAGVLFGAAIGSLTGGAAAWAGDAAGLSGLGGAALSSLIGGTGGLASTLAMNAWTAQPLMDNAVYGAAIGALAPLASGEAMVIGGAALAPDSALGYILNTGTNVVSVGLGP